MNDLGEIVRIYEGSDGDATKALYAQLCAAGVAGAIAMNVFRTMKASERAKVYRGRNSFGSYRGQAYDKKQWSMNQLASLLAQHADAFGIRWGWAEDPQQQFHRWILYVDLPTGQCSFHTDRRGTGRDYPGQWDGAKRSGPDRICRWCARLLVEAAHAAAVR